MPVSFSRTTWFTRSILTCIDLNSGIAVRSIRPMITAMSGMMIAIIADSCTSCLSAMKMPPTIMIGARIITLSIIMTTICTCWTSLVFRVMSEGAPKVLISVAEKLSTRRKIAPRTSRPNAIAVFEPK